MIRSYREWLPLVLVLAGIAYVAHLKGWWAHLGFGQESHVVLRFKTGEVVGYPASRERCEAIQEGLKPGFYVIATEQATGRKERVEKAWCVPPAIAGVVTTVGARFLSLQVLD